MPRKKWQTVDNFDAGFNFKRDVTQLPAGSLIIGSYNVKTTDGDRVGIRNGSQLLGLSSQTIANVTSLHNFKKRDGSEILMRAYSDKLEYYHTGTEAWELLNDGYTSGQTFGFANHNINDEANDFVYFCNAVEAYSRWNGAFTQLDGALTGGETEIEVDSTLQDQVFFSGTASSSTTTTITIATTEWATDIWNGFYVRITSGAQAGKISKITDTTGTQLTFGTISGLSGTPTFEVRQVKFADSGTIRIGSSDVTYSSIDQDNRFAGVSGAPAASDRAAVAQAVTEYPGNPKGNIMLVEATRVYVSGVKDSPSTLYYSAIADATDFTFSATRIADEGGVIDTPEGGGPITGLALLENTIIILKQDLIKTLNFTQDGNDLPIINPLIKAPLVGPVNNQSTFEVDNQVYYATIEGGVKSIQQVANINFRQALQLSDPIVQLVNKLDFSNAAGIFYKQKAYIACKGSGADSNNVVLVFNYQKGHWEAPIVGWNVSSWAIYNNKLYYGHSVNAEVYEAEAEGIFDDAGANILARARFAYNVYGNPPLQKKVSNLFVEGYMSEGTNLSFRVFYNYLGITTEKEFTLSGTDEQYMLQSYEFNILGAGFLGEFPLGISEGDLEDNPNGLQRFRVYFPLQVEKFYEMAIDVESDQVDAQWEITRFATDTEVHPVLNTSLKKGN